MTKPTEALSASIDVLTTFLVGDQTMGETLRRIADLGESAIAGADRTGITLLTRDGGFMTAACTHPETAILDELQYEVGDGPCLAAFREMRIIKVPKMEEERRWPEVADRASAKGVRSSLSAPLVVADRGIGALNFYSHSPDAFTPDDEGAAQTFGLHAAVVLANAQAYWTAYDLSQQLERAMANRAEIEQAKGVIIEQSGVTSDEAFELLKRASQRENRKLREISAEIVKRAQERRR